MLAGTKTETKYTPPESFAPVITPIPMSAAPSETIPDVPAAQPVDDVVTGFVRGGIITPKGILRVGDTMVVDGIDESIKRISFTDATVWFESGKKYKK
jgi:hypothetical protein